MAEQRNRSQRWATGVLAVVVIYLIARIFQWVLSLPTIDGPDSHSFLPGDGLGIPPNWYFGFEKVSFTGNGVIRPWTVALPYALLGADFIRSFVQMLFSAVSFLVLAGVIYRATRPRGLAITLSFITLGLSLTTLVTSWDMLINRESIAISLTALTIAGALYSTRHFGWVPYVATNVAALLLTITRPTIAPLTVGLLVALLVVRWIKVRNTAPSGRVVSAVVGLGLITVTVLYPAWFSSRMDASWASWYGHTMSETQFGYVVADYNPRADALREALGNDGAPQCLIDSLPVYTGEYLGAPWGFAANMRDTCSGFSEWYQDNWPGWYYRYVAANPNYVLKLTMSGVPLALEAWDNGETTSLLPAPLRNLLFASNEGPEGLGVYDPLFLYWAVIAGIAILGLVRFRGSVRPWLHRRWPEAVIVAAVVLGSLASIVVNLVLIPSYPLETNRVNVSTALAIRAVGGLVATALVWQLVVAIRASVRTRRNSGTSTGPARTSE